MRFLANENFPAPSIALMRQAGYDVLSIQETIPGAKDTVVISEALRSDRIILTFDKDYGELIFKQGIPDPPAVIFLRYRGADPLAAARLVFDLISGGTNIERVFTVVEVDGIRQRMY
jgi:predicted nuclease of predicted toxin-antitoxin system